MEQINTMGFQFIFSSGRDKVDSDWNECNWDDFNNAPYIPLVGDILNFDHIMNEIDDGKDNMDKIEGYENLLNDYKTYLFQVDKREFQPFTNSDKNFNKIGVWHLYYLTISPVEIKDISHQHRDIQKRKENLKVQV